ncbi:MAG: hypothetical protein M1818_002672 [Claussenomyces sp. TS43310]|nr:MAG: hypothetical protein M1818_002672 [Claussenomyces sp. TS43310]
MALVEPEAALMNSANPCKPASTFPDYYTGNSSPDPLTTWYTANDDPWDPILKADPNRISYPRTSQERRYDSRPHGPFVQVASKYRQMVPSDCGSTRDSGYESMQSLGPASIRSGDLACSVFERQSNVGGTLGRLECDEAPVPGTQMGSCIVPPTDFFTQDTTIYCQDCQISFKSQPELKSHLKRIHHLNAEKLEEFLRRTKQERRREQDFDLRGVSPQVYQSLDPESAEEEQTASLGAAICQGQIPDWGDQDRTDNSPSSSPAKVDSHLDDSIKLASSEQCHPRQDHLASALNSTAELREMESNHLGSEIMLDSKFTDPLALDETARKDLTAAYSATSPNVPDNQGGSPKQDLKVDPSSEEAIIAALAMARFAGLNSPAEPELRVKTRRLQPSRRGLGGARKRNGFILDADLGDDFGNTSLEDDLSPAPATDIKVFLKALSIAGFKITKEGPSSAEQELTEKSESATAKQKTESFACKICHKLVRQPCQLRKHMKRHDRPWGCTSRGCKKLFGSKADWKRHETTQHFVPESWRCTIPGINGKECRTVRYQSERFKEHLYEHHKMSHVTDGKVDEYRIGNNFHTNFWCGFCQRTVDVDPKKRHDSWNERYNHIDDHFWGRNDMQKQSISEWVHAADPTLHDPSDSTESPSSDLSEGDSEYDAENLALTTTPGGLLDASSDQSVSQSQETARNRKHARSSVEENRPAKRVRKTRRKVKTIICVSFSHHDVKRGY